MYAVILAGGGGTRLWPLSDPQHPKPFLPLFPDGSLLQKTVHRLTAGTELDLTESDLTVVTDQHYEGLVREQLPGGVSVLSEPVGRNTAAAIAYVALAVERDPDDVMVVLPADHFMADEPVFRSVLADAENELARGAFGINSPLVTLGAHAKYAATQYGYLIPDYHRGITNRLTAYPLLKFEEKPTSARAEELRRQPGVAWNAGIFMARRRAFLSALGRYTKLIEILEPAVRRGSLDEAYQRVDARSIDYEVMEPAARDHLVVMGAMDVGWSDVGTWTALLDTLFGGYDGDARVVQAGESVALGPDDVMILRTEDGRLTFEPGPLPAVTSSYPQGYLPDARRHEQAIRDLVGRVVEWETARSTALAQA